MFRSKWIVWVLLVAAGAATVFGQDVQAQAFGGTPGGVQAAFELPQK
jgi:hypothetical protein